MKKIIIVTGARDSGKTRFAAGINGELTRQGITTRGILAPGYYVSGQKEGFDLEMLPGHDRFRFFSTTPEDGWLPAGRFWFDPGTLVAGRLHLLRHTEGNPILIIDELGPLELKNMIWAETISTLLRCDNTTSMIWVVREQCVENITRHFGVEPILVLKAGVTSPREAAADIIRLTGAGS